jgi:hypothetical protein
MSTNIREMPRRTGPKTPEGKARVANNAITHGLTAKTVVLATESQEAFNFLLASLVDEWSPATDSEFLLVEEMAAAAWRQRRAWALETAHYNRTMKENEPELQKQFDKLDHGTRTAAAHQSLIEKGKALANIQRHEERLSRQYDRALRRLMELQRHRRELEKEIAAAKNEQNNFEKPATPAPESTPPALHPIEISEHKEKPECTGPSSRTPNPSSMKP